MCNKISVAVNNEKIPTNPAEIIKDPMFLEFLGFEKKSHYYEKELESSLM